MARVLLIVASLVAAIFFIVSASDEKCQLCQDFYGDISDYVNANPTDRKLIQALSDACETYFDEDPQSCNTTETLQLPYVKKCFEQGRAVIDICRDLERC